MKILPLAAAALCLLGACSTPQNLSPAAVKAAKAQAESDLPTLASAVAQRQPDRDAIEAKLHAYLEARPAIYGAAFAPGPPIGNRTPPPALYVHRHGGRLVTTELSLPNYNYPRMEWYWGAADRRKPWWTAPYYDVAGGHTWMMTYSVPIIAGNGAFGGVVTNDVAVPKPRND